MNDRFGLVALDFDMTLIHHTAHGMELPAVTRAQLTELVASGVHAGIVSGRYVWEMQDILERLGMKWANPFPTFYITREAFLYRLEKGAMAPDREWNDARAEETSRFMRRLSAEAGPLAERMEAEGMRLYKWILYSDYALEFHLSGEEEADAALRLIRERLQAAGIDAHVHRNRSVANVMHPRTGKGASLLRLAETMGLRPEQVLAVGDSLNDVDMLDGRFGFAGAAVSNAAPAVKAAVAARRGIIAGSPAGLGVAEIIAHYRSQGRFATNG